MKNKSNNLDRLLRSAAAAPAVKAADATLPWTLEQRVLAALRSRSAEEDFSWLAPLLRRAFAAAGALVLACAFLALHSNTSTAANSAAVPEHALAVADLELTRVIVP
jgi:hypothetical protein